MFLKNIKKIFKLKFPILSNKLISIRDNNKFFRSLNEGRDLDVNKNVHGKKIVKINNNQNNNDIFLSYSFRPKFEKDTFKNLKFLNNSENTAIIIQGPIKNYETFVIETIKIYSKIFPEALIVLSTWKDEVNESKESENLYLESIKESLLPWEDRDAVLSFFERATKHLYEWVPGLDRSFLSQYVHDLIIYNRGKEEDIFYYCFFVPKKLVASARQSKGMHPF